MAVIGTVSGHELGLAVSAFFVPRIVQAESQPARNLSPPDLTLEGLRLADVDYAAPAALGGCSGGGGPRRWPESVTRTSADGRGSSFIVTFRQ